MKTSDLLGRMRFWLAVPFVCASAFAQAPPALPPALEWLPQGAVAVLRIEQPAELLDAASRWGLLEALSANPDLRNLERLFEPLGGKSFVSRLTAGGVTVAAYPGDRTVVITEARDAASLEPVHKLAQTLVALQKNSPKASDRVFYREHPGGASWSFDGKQFFATMGSRLAMSSRADVLKALFQPRPADFQPLASWAALSEARKRLEGGAGWLFLNMALLNQEPNFRKALAGDGSALDVIIAGFLRQSLQNAPWAGLALTVQANALQIRGYSGGRLPPAMAFTAPEPGKGLLPKLSVPRELASASLWRDLAMFYSARDVIFPERSSAGILFENFMEIFFSGRDLKNEVFARFHPAVRLVVAEQRYDPAVGVPEEPYPAVALVFRVDRPEEFGEVFEEAWQKAIGITNFTRGQQALPGIILDKATHAGITFTYGYFSVRGEKDRSKLPAHFNVRPALARTGPYFILSSTDQLARDLIDAVQREDGRTPPPASAAHTLIEIASGEQIAALLEANRASYLRQSVLSGGKKPEAAAKEFDNNIALLRRIAGATLSFTSADGQMAELTVRMK